MVLSELVGKIFGIAQGEVLEKGADVYMSTVEQVGAVKLGLVVVFQVQMSRVSK